MYHSQALPAQRKAPRRKAAAAALLSAAIVFLIVLLAVSPAHYAAACLEGVSLWAKAVLPSLFPFFILTALLTKLGCRDMGYVPAVDSRVFGRWVTGQTEAEIARAAGAPPG